MTIKIRRNSKLRRELGDEGTELLEYGLGAISRILPHTEDGDWVIGASEPTSVTWGSAARRELKLRLYVDVGNGYTVSGTVRRRTIPLGVGHISRTLDLRELGI